MKPAATTTIETSPGSHDNLVQGGGGGQQSLPRWQAIKVVVRAEILPRDFLQTLGNS